MDVLNLFLTPDLYSATLRLAAPLIFAVVGGVISERAGILNMALEGQILMGSFFGYLGAVVFNNAIMGVLCAIMGSCFIASLHAFMSIHVKVNQVVSALGLNLLSLGITSTMFRFFGEGTSQMTTSPGFSNIYIPGLSDLPFVGPILFSQNPLTYLAFVAVILVTWFMFRTSRGLELRAAGENPKALDVAGVNVFRIRYTAVIATGVFCGLAGCCLTITGLNNFFDNISAGRGFIAYAAVVFGKWTPVGGMLAALLFGAGDALQLRLQSMFDIPYYFFLMMPYLITFFALVFFMGSSRGPAATNVPFETDKARKKHHAKRPHNEGGKS